MNNFFKCSLFFVAICLTATGTFAAELIVADNGDGRYSVNGFAMDGVAGIDLTISYDSSSLSSPTVSQGSLISGAMMAANTNNPGTIKVAIINTKPFTGSGQVIAVNFAGKTASGGITSITTKMINLKYETLPSQASVAPAAQTTTGGGSWPFAQDNSTAQQSQLTVTTPKPATATAATPSIGMLTLYDEGKQPAPPKKQEQAAQPPQQPDQFQPAPTTNTRGEENRPPEAKTKQPDNRNDELKKIAYSSVIERFKSLRGERQLPAFAELFTKPVSEEAVQEPALTVSNGKDGVRIMAKLVAGDDNSAPNFAANDARILALKRDETTGRWIIDLVPAKDAVTPSLSILLGNRLYEIPLVVVPPVRKLTFSEKEISAFLKDYGARKPEFDLNGDGKHDYLDDYLYTGHYLLNRKNVPTRPEK